MIVLFLSLNFMTAINMYVDHTIVLYLFLVIFITLVLFLTLMLLMNSYA